MKGRRLLRSTGLLLALALAVDAPRPTGNVEVVTQSGTRIGNRLLSPALMPMVWRLHDPTTTPGCYSSTNAPPVTLEPALQTAYDDWQTDPDSSISFSYGGPTVVRDQGADGINLVTFCDSAVLASDQGFGAQATTTAMTVPITVIAGGGCPAGQGPLPGLGYCFPAGLHRAGTIVDADIRFNSFGSREEQLATNGAIGGLDPSTQLTSVRDLAAHEIGHQAGLSHDPLPTSMMFWFVEPNPPSDGRGEGFLSRSDRSTIGRYYPEPSHGAAYGTITGRIRLDGVAADGVHVVAIDPTTLLAVAGRLSLSRFEDPAALGPEGSDASTQGAGFYRIDGLPPGEYYVYAEVFDDSDMLQSLFPGRLSNRYNVTIAASNVAPGSGGAGALGFLPVLAEFYDAGESGNGGDGSAPGTAADDSDATALVTVAAGAVTPGIDIALNIEPPNGQTPAQRQNPTTRATLVNDDLQPTDLLWNFFMDGGADDFYAVRFPASLLPAPPYNVAEGLWIHAGLSTLPMETRLALGDPASPFVPDASHPVVPSAGRVLTGGPGGLLAGGFLHSVRDQWNVTVNEPVDLFVLVHQPDPPPGADTFPEAPLALVTCSSNDCSTPARVGRTLVTQNGGADWSALANADLFYDLVVEQHPPVMITGAAPAEMNAGETGDVVLDGFGFRPGATVDFGPDITVDSVTWLGPQQLRAGISIALTGATTHRAVDVRVTNPGVLFPNVSRVFTVRPLLDDDGDGTPNLTDCAPLDGTLAHPASEVLNLQIAHAGDSVTITWDSQDGAAGTATDYDIVAGEVAQLRSEGGFASAVCVADDVPDAPFVAAAAVPPGAARYWLIRACNACNAGACSFGDSGLTPDPRDALDAAPPCP